jgi:hypothetical protein
MLYRTCDMCYIAFGRGPLAGCHCWLVQQCDSIQNNSSCVTRVFSSRLPHSTESTTRLRSLPRRVAPPSVLFPFPPRSPPIRRRRVPGATAGLSSSGVRLTTTGLGEPESVAANPGPTADSAECDIGRSTISSRWLARTVRDERGSGGWCRLRPGSFGTSSDCGRSRGLPARIGRPRRQVVDGS